MTIAILVYGQGARTNQIWSPKSSSCPMLSTEAASLCCREVSVLIVVLHYTIMTMGRRWRRIAPSRTRFWNGLRSLSYIFPNECAISIFMSKFNGSIRGNKVTIFPQQNTPSQAWVFGTSSFRYLQNRDVPVGTSLCLFWDVHVSNGEILTKTMRHEYCYWKCEYSKGQWNSHITCISCISYLIHPIYPSFLGKVRSMKRELLDMALGRDTQSQCDHGCHEAWWNNDVSLVGRAGCTIEENADRIYKQIIHEKSFILFSNLRKKNKIRLA